MTSGPEERIRAALEAGAEARERLERYGVEWRVAARAAATRARGPEGGADLERLRTDWERTAAAFRRTADRIGTALKTLGREC